ncbi:MAG: C39 family peptidase [Patescibacteria group bacterium]
MSSKIKKIISSELGKYISVIIIIVVLFGFWIYKNQKPELIKVDLPPAKEHQDFVSQNTNEDLILEEEIVVAEKPREEIKQVIEEPVEIIKPLETPGEPQAINLALPFTSQAPTGNWDQPYQDACEEASLLMVDYYYQAKKMPSQEAVETILSSMVSWQEENWGGHHNLPIAKLAEYIRLFYDYRVEVVENVTVSQLKDFLNEGRPIIVPADGHKLANPFFSGDGPDYHMLVIKGYVDNNFITNDPGTRRGEDFVYSSQNMMDSIFDWDTKKSSATGPKNVLVLYND